MFAVKNKETDLYLCGGDPPWTDDVEQAYRYRRFNHAVMDCRGYGIHPEDFKVVVVEGVPVDRSTVMLEQALFKVRDMITEAHWSVTDAFYDEALDELQKAHDLICNITGDK